jgi:lysozyme
MPKTNYKPTKRRKIHQTRRKNTIFEDGFSLILGISLIFTGFYLKNKIAFYYAMHFHKHTEQNLKNSKTEAARIEKIITEYNDKTFGFISHYQKKEDIKWDSLTIANDGINLEFVVMRATMGKKER